MTAEAWATADRMNELETLMWRSERHPWLSSTMTAVMLLDRAPDWDRLRAAHDWGVALVPRFRQRVVEPAVPVGPPAWVADRDFRLDYHLRRAQIPPPASRAQLLELAQSFALTPFDRARPLWEAVVVEDLDDGRAAYVLKLHHSVTDAAGFVQLSSELWSRQREHTTDKPSPQRTAEGQDPDPARLAADEIAEQVGKSPALAGRLLAAGARALIHPTSTASDALGLAAALRRTASPPAAPSPLFRERTGKDWRFGVLECPLADLRAAAKAALGSVNDAYVGVLLGGLRRYHERFGIDIVELPMAMPISVRKADDPLGGNRFAGAMLAGPIGVVDPAERIASIRGAVLSARAQLAPLSLVGPVLNRMPSAVGALLGRLGATADLSASNVPGVAHPVYMAGARVERMFAFGPLPGVAVMAGMNSHDGTCCFGINCDGRAVADPRVLMECLEQGLDEVLTLA